MIRFINLTGQITCDDDDFWFAWYDTITNTFMSFDDIQVFDSWEDFVECWKETKIYPLERFESLFKKKRI